MFRLFYSLYTTIVFLTLISICLNSVVDDSEWELLSHPPSDSATLPPPKRVEDDLIEFRLQPKPTPAPQTLPRQEGQRSRDQGGYLFDGPSDDIVAFYRSQQVQKLKRLLFIVVIDAGSSKTAGFLWQTTVTSEMNKMPMANWRNMTMREILSKEQNLRAFSNTIKSEEQQILASEMAKYILAPIITRAREVIGKLVQGLDPNKVIGDIPVFVHSTAGLRDMEIDFRKRLFDAITMVFNGDLERENLLRKATGNFWKFYPSPPLTDDEKIVSTRFEVKAPKNDKVVKVMRFFTTPVYCRAITGIEEAVFTFITANVALGAIQEMKTDPTKGKKRLAGILEVGGASMQVVFPVENQIRDGPLGTLDLTAEGRFLKREMFPKMTEPFNVFGTSYMNLGINRAHALLMKMYCEAHKTPERRCFFPCLNVGWRQVCVPGSPMRRQLKSKDNGVSPFETDETGRVKITNNHLYDTAHFCNIQNKILSYMLTPLLDCRRAGFNVMSHDLAERAKIDSCDEVVGTGNHTECAAIIRKHLFLSELPGNQETLSETGAAAPAEIGQFLSPKGLMFVVGGSLFYPIKQLKEWGMLEPTWYKSKITNEIRQCDLTKLEEAAAILCGVELSPRHTFINPKSGTNEEVSFHKMNFDFCFKAVYADTLLKSINAATRTVQVQFVDQIRHSESKQLLDFGWTYGALTTRMLDKSFINDLFLLGSKYYRSPQRPLRLAEEEEFS